MRISSFSPIIRVFLKCYIVLSFIVFLIGGFQTPVYGAEEPGTGITYSCVDFKAGVNNTDVFGNCTWYDLVAGLQKLITVARDYALGFSVVIIAWAGYLYLTSGDSPGQRKEANDMFVKVAWGIFYVLGAWLIVKLITGALLNEDYLKAVPFGS